MRIKSLISSTRVAAVETAEKSGFPPSVADLEEVDLVTEEEDDEPQVGEEEKGGNDGISHDQVSRGLAKIYQQTLELLGDELV